MDTQQQQQKYSISFSHECSRIHHGYSVSRTNECVVFSDRTAGFLALRSNFINTFKPRQLTNSASVPTSEKISNYSFTGSEENRISRKERLSVDRLFRCENNVCNWSVDSLLFLPLS